DPVLRARRPGAPGRLRPDPAVPGHGQPDGAAPPGRPAVRQAHPLASRPVAEPHAGRRALGLTGPDAAGHPAGAVRPAAPQDGVEGDPKEAVMAMQEPEQREQGQGLRDQAVRRWKKKHDFRAHLLVFTLVNTFLVAIWAATGAGFFWPVFVI